MTDGTPPAHALERLIFFSDAVFAIAITLLIIEIHVPHLRWGAPDVAYLHALAELTPSFLGFVISFAVIGAFWAGHHRAFSLAAHFDQRLVAANLSMLGAIVFMPFATAFMSANVGMRVPTALYTLTMFVTALLNIRMVRMATSPPVVAADADATTVALTRARGRAVALGAGSAFVVSLFAPWFAQFALISIPVWRRILNHRIQRAARPA